MRRNQQRGGVIAWALFALTLFVVVIVGALISAGVFVAHNVQISHKSGKDETRIETPFGRLRVKERASLDPKALGVPVYPGAVRSQDAHKLASFEFDFADNHSDLVVSAAEFVTDDPISRVEAWYRERHPDAIVRHDRRFHAALEWKQDGSKRVVLLRERGSRTHIVLASAGEPAAN